LPAMIEAVKVRATLGEISHRLARLWGAYRPA
jgi:methylmalonyl-CoA mutase N-terminal domain/subunit